jgi:hypothetical protein
MTNDLLHAEVIESMFDVAAFSCQFYDVAVAA